MKPILCITLAFMLAFTAQAQTSVRVTSETVGFWTMKLPADTMLIKKTDNIIRGSVYVPSFSADSVKISGCTFTVGGIVSSHIMIPPGEAAVNFGFDYALSDTIRIITKTTGTGWVLLLKKRN
jgi:hypothetical protein